MSKTLTTAQLNAMRTLDPSDEHAPTSKPHRQTLNVLRRHNLVELRNGEDRLTPAGLKMIRSYVKRTGNGPEDLKAMFRF